MKKISEERIYEFESYLCREEKSPITIQKYLRDMRNFNEFVNGREMNKDVVLDYKKQLMDKGYGVNSINSILSSINAFFTFEGWIELKVKHLRKQQEIFCPEDKELTREEYIRLVEAAKNNERLCLVLMTMGSTGIRVSELRYFTVEAVAEGKSMIYCKNKIRVVLIPKKLQKLLMNYAKKKGIESGEIFVTRLGNSLDRSNIWTQMKGLCKKAKVNPKKVYPHNFRKLSAKTFYEMDKDVAKLADLKSGKWIATITFKGKRYYLGSYEKKEWAIEARKEGEQMHEEFLDWYYKTIQGNKCNKGNE
ncbi:hypothetical protein P261_01977 [Lachnospiraceae bacterium TWA4]|nr:hypothetical protein P261_01977 [Lachnospiraceae bacterium TWA4]